MVPVVYQTVLSTVPGMHRRPAVTPSPSGPLPPNSGYDFVLHVGVAGPGPLRVEKLARKTGYHGPDINNYHAPIVRNSEGVLECGFGEGYEDFPQVLHTKIDTVGLTKHLKSSGIDVSNINLASFPSHM